VNGVAERVENRRDFEIDAGIVLPDISHRERNVFGEAAVGIDSDAFRIGTSVTTSSHTIPAATANQMTFAADYVADLKIIDVSPDFNDFAHKFVPQNGRNFYRLLRPIVPVPNMNVRSADSRLFDANQNVVDSHCRFWNVFDPQTDLRFAFYNRFHFGKFQLF
jgi:hypothetical protein